jgi:drug/metabolite transporter (DMT)-like permease
MALLCWAMGVKVKPSRAKLPAILFTGFLASGVYMILFMEGMKRIGAAEGAITLATAPIFIAVISFLRGDEKFTWRWLAGTVIAFTGVVLANFEGLSQGKEGIGFFIILASAVVWAVSVHLFKPHIAEHGALAAMTLSLPGGLLAMAPYAAPGLISFDYSKLTWVGWLMLAYLILVAGSTTFVIYYRALHDLGAAKGSVTQYLIPPTAALFAVLVLGSPLKALQIVGLLFALGGVALAQWRRKDPTEGKMEL